MSMQMENEKVNIPNDLALKILSKLPVKSLKRFRCVRKSWADLLDDPHFMRMYLENLTSKNDDSCVLLVQQVPNSREENLFLLSGEKYENRVKLDWPSPFQEHPTDILVYGSCINGTICIHRGTRIHGEVVFWNPSTEECKIIPPGLTHVPGLDFMKRIHGFGYDHVTDDYKLIQDVCCFDDPYHPIEIDQSIFPDPFWQIYSLKDNCWRKLDLEMPPEWPLIVGSAVYLNGVCHWWGIDENNEEAEAEDYLVSFDMSSEMFHTTSIARRPRYDFVDRNLVVLKGSVALISKDARNNCYELTILGEVGVKKSWVKLLTIGPFPYVEEPIGVGKNGNIFFRKTDDELAWFDLSTQRMEDIGIKGKANCCQTFIYKESLLPLIGGIN